MCRDIDYCTRQLAAILDDIEIATRIEPDQRSQQTIAVALVNTASRATRADLIEALEGRGFTVVSTPQESPIRVDATVDTTPVPGDRAAKETLPDDSEVDTP